MDQIHHNQCCEMSPTLIFPSHTIYDKQLKQVSSSELPSSSKQSIFSNKHCPISGRPRNKYQAKIAKPQEEKITRTKRVVYNPRQTCDTFVVSKHRRKLLTSFEKYPMLSSLSPSPASSLSFAQSLTLVISCCIVATLNLDFANLILASNNFISANDISTSSRLMINKNHNHKYHHHHQTSPANLQPKNFNTIHRHDTNFNRDSSYKTEQNNEINTHLLNHYHKQKQHNYSYHNKQKSLSQQVPEQLPIVVSLSDNSYVSASPVELTTISTTNTANEHISPQKIRKHRTRYLLHHLSSSNSFSRRNNDDTNINHHHHQQQEHHRSNQPNHPHNHHQKPSMHVYNNDLSTNNPVYNYNDLQNDDGRDKKEKDEDEVYENAQQLASSSDISTTATTTQRNSNKYRKNLVQMYDTSDPEDQDQDEATKQKGLGAHYRIKSAAIIKTRESIDMGATFINYTIVTNLNACLVECWITDSCDTAIYQESPVDFNNNNIDHLPDSFVKSKEHYPLTSLVEPPHITQSTLSSNFIDESKAIFDSNKIYISDNNINGGLNKKNNADTQDDLVEDDNEISKGDPNKENQNNDLNNDNRGDDDRNGEYSSNSDNKQSKITSNFDTRLPENGFFICYLFECVKPDGFKCQFSAHNYYVSATKRRPVIDITAAFTTDPKNGSIEPTTTNNGIDLDEPFVSNNISDKTISSLSNKTLSEELDRGLTAQDYCGQNKFKCGSQDQCIPNSYRCDGIFHCSDQSDELECNSREKAAISYSDLTTLDGYSIVMSDGSMKSDQILESTNSQISHSKDSLYDKVDTEYPKGDISEVQRVAESGRESPAQKQNHILIDEAADKIKGGFIVDLSKSTSNNIEPLYSNIITSQSNYHPINNRKQWHDSHIASIRMSQEEYDYGYQKRGNGMNSAIIAIMFGIGVTGMLVVIVGHKMKSIGKRIAYKGRRRSLVPDMDFLINTMPI